MFTEKNEMIHCIVATEVYACMLLLQSLTCFHPVSSCYCLENWWSRNLCKRDKREGDISPYNWMRE